MKPIVLAILDGWGLSPAWGGNAIEMNSPANFNYLWRNYPHLVLKSFFSERSDRGSLANSEIGHMMIGCGREILADCELIDEETSRAEFFSNPELLTGLEMAKNFGSDIHLIGLVSEGCIHSSYQHLLSLLKFYRKNNYSRVYIHVITDGRDVEETSAGIYVDKLLKAIQEIGVGEIATVCGRNFAMDRDNNWQKTESYYNLITGSGFVAKAFDGKQAVHQAYSAGFSDEFIPPTMIIQNGFPVSFIKSNDVVVLFNYRSDRMRQLILALTGLKKFRIFKRSPQNIRISTILKYHFSEYTQKNISPVFNENEIKESLPEILSRHSLNVLKVAESEKLAHVTYFFNGGRDQPFAGEQRVIIKSNNFSSHNKAPEMKAVEITHTISENAYRGNFGLIVANFANVDEIGHTGDLLATSKAVEVVDNCLKELTHLVDADRITLIVTADHGNGEQMVGNRLLESEAYHTLNPVPFIMADKKTKFQVEATALGTNDLLALTASKQHSLKDIAPTILEMLSISKPQAMTGNSLLSDLKIK